MVSTLGPGMRPGPAHLDDVAPAKGYEAVLFRLILQEQTGIRIPSFGETYQAATDGKAVGETLLKNGVESSEWHEITQGNEQILDAVLMTGIYKIDGR